MILTDLDFATVSETKSGLSALLRRLKETQRALAVTSHGKPAAVLMDFEEYRRLIRRAQGLEAALKAYRDSSAREKAVPYSVTTDPIAAFRGSGSGGSVKALLEERRRERARERAKERARRG